MVEHKLADVLKRKKVSKRELAKRIGIQYSHVFRFFRKGYDPKLSMLARWSDALGVPIGKLYRKSK